MWANLEIIKKSYFFFSQKSHRTFTVKMSDVDQEEELLEPQTGNTMTLMTMIIGLLLLYHIYV